MIILLVYAAPVLIIMIAVVLVATIVESRGNNASFEGTVEAGESEPKNNTQANVGPVPDCCCVPLCYYPGNSSCIGGGSCDGCCSADGGCLCADCSGCGECSPELCTGCFEVGCGCFEPGCVEAVITGCIC